MTQELTPAVVVAHYVKLRNKKEQLVAAHKREVKAINDQMDKLASWLHTMMIEEGLNSLPTDDGTAYTLTTEYASVTDMDALLAYVREHDAWHLLDKRVSKVGIREILDEGNPLPPGVNWFVKQEVRVRKANERKDDERSSSD